MKDAQNRDMMINLIIFNSKFELGFIKDEIKQAFNEHILDMKKDKDNNYINEYILEEYKALYPTMIKEDFNFYLDMLCKNFSINSMYNNGYMFLVKN